MDDLDVLARDIGLGARGKSNPMRSAAPDRRSIEDPLFSNVFSRQPTYTASSSFSNSNKHPSFDDFDYGSIFKSSASGEQHNNSNTSSSLPVYDKPMYDDDIFDGLPGLKSNSSAPNVRFDDDMLGSISSPPTSKSVNNKSDIDDLLGNLGKKEKIGENNNGGNAKSYSGSKGFDDLLPGFGSSSSAGRDRPIPESNWGSMPTAASKSTLDDSYVIVESNSTPHSSSTVSKNPSDEIGQFSKSRSARAEVSSGSGSPSHSATPSREPTNNSYFEYSERININGVPVDQEPPLFDVPNVSTGFQKTFGRMTSPPDYYGSVSQTDTSSTYDEIWLTVSEVPLITQPTAAPPPSCPPPPIPRQASNSETSSFSSSSRKKGDEFSSPSNYNQHSHSRPAAKGPPVSQFDEFDELEDFAMGGLQNSFDGSANVHYSTETNDFSAAATSAAAMKDAMDKAEAKFKLAKEVREREYAQTARNKDQGPLETDEQVFQEEFRESQERFEHDRKQQEEEEREQRRLDRERLRELEREKARQAVERATREARERAAAEARKRAAAEARLKSERTAVEKANAEARARAERAAVQRAQAEVRERAAAEAKARAEKAAAEARERAAAEAREKEALEKATAAKSEAEARRRSERAAVERAAAEARERAAAEARDRAAAAAAAKLNQQKNDNDLESFFSMGRASSAPRARTTSTDPFFDQEYPNKGESEAAKRTSPSTGTSSYMKKTSSTSSFVDDLSSILGAAPPSGEFQDIEGETDERRRARMERHQRTQERAAKALAEKNQRDLQAQREQEERHRHAETLDFEIKRWAAGKEGNLRALLSTLQYVLWPECGWQPVSLTDLITGASVKKVYRKATLCIHPDKVQQKGANLQQKYIAEKVFDLLKEAWNKFNSEELF